MAESGGGKGSLVWNYFTRITDIKAKCNTCGKELASTSGSTSSLARHLESKHREEFATYLEAKETREKERNQGKRKKDDSFNFPLYPLDASAKSFILMIDLQSVFLKLFVFRRK